MLNETQIADVWLLFNQFIDKKQLEVAAESYVDLLADFGVSDRALQGATGNDEYLDQAVAYYLEDSEGADDDLDADDDYYEDDED
jgi:hypothetical protein